MIGAWGVGYTYFDIMTMFIFGIIGYFLRLREFPMAPMVLGVLVGGVADYSLRRALITYEGRIFEMLTRPFGIFLIAAFIIVLVGQFRNRIKDKKAEAAKANTIDHDVE